MILIKIAITILSPFFDAKASFSKDLKYLSILAARD